MLTIVHYRIKHTKQPPNMHHLLILLTIQRNPRLLQPLPHLLLRHHPLLTNNLRNLKIFHHHNPLHLLIILPQTPLKLNRFRSSIISQLSLQRPIPIPPNPQTIIYQWNLTQNRSQSLLIKIYILTTYIRITSFIPPIKSLTQIKQLPHQPLRTFIQILIHLTLLPLPHPQSKIII